MKNTMLFCCTGLLTGLSTMAQTVNDKSIKTLNSNFALITSVCTYIDNNDVAINFGKEDKKTVTQYLLQKNRK